MGDIAVAWFRRDLRLADNPAWAAAASHAFAVPVVVLEPRLLAAAGPHRLRAYLGAVASLERSLRGIGASLRVAVGDAAEEILGVAAELGASTVCVNADVTPYAARRDRRVADGLGFPLDAHWGMLVHPPGAVLTRKGTLSQVFTPFWRRWQTLQLRPEAHARRGPATGAEAAMSLPEAMAAVGTATAGRQAFVRQLAWRDWYAHLTRRHPDIADAAIRVPYDRVAWRHGPSADRDFGAWTAGLTGYPIVDAAMRQLAGAGVRLGVDYPTPIIDHDHARQRTLAAYRSALGKAHDGNPPPSPA